jgi:hypothetical protein
VDPWAKTFPIVWLSILGCVGMEYFYLLGLFRF